MQNFLKLYSAELVFDDGKKMLYIPLNTMKTKLD